MKTAIIFYSYTGKTKKLVEKLAKENGASLIEIKECKRPSTIAAYILGSMKARKQRKVDIIEEKHDLSGIDRIMIAAPIWAGYPAPVFNNMLDLIPKGKEVELIFVSGSGSSNGSKQKTIALASTKGIHVVKYRDVKA